MREQLERVRERIIQACARSRRDPAAVRLVAATKTVPSETLRLLTQLHCVDFGENRVQEALPKLEALSALPIRWHFIGRLQRNKAKFIPGRFEWIHSVDSAPLAIDLSRRSVLAEKEIHGLVEVNLSAQPQKGGVLPEALPVLLDRVRGLPCLQIEGLMTLAPLGAGEQSLRKIFSAARELAARHELRELSMGMSDDFEIAIEEGATMVRIGRAIFGERPARPV